MENKTDPMAKALWEYYRTKEERFIEVSSDISLPEEMAASYFFRTFSAMNSMERYAMEHAKGKVLDLGAGAGCHSRFLQEKGIEVVAIESSREIAELLKETGVNQVINERWQDWESPERFDTILLLMNGAGMAAYLSELPAFLKKLSTLLTDGGCILMDSSDISYLYELEDGSRIMDLGGSYPGEIVYTVEYEGEQSSFPWLFITMQDLKTECDKLGLSMTVVCELEESYLAEIKVLSLGNHASSL
jgi:SAM-dependent methyltransferase